MSHSSIDVTAPRKRVCIVTPDLIGPIKNGGIGTHAHHLARELAIDHDVTVLFTGPVENENEAHWKRIYRNYGVDFLQLNEVREPVSSNSDWFIRRSFVIFKYLRDKDFDFIHFQEWQANGLHCIMAKQTTPYFQNTTLTVEMHSSTEWINEGMNQWAYWPVPDAKQEWCERYCCQFADVVISPSQYMLDYCNQRRWTLAADARVMRNCFEKKSLPSFYVPEQGVIAFFGRLETRKGLEVFLQALAALKPEQRARIKNLLFLGKIGDLTGVGSRADVAIQESMNRLGLAYELHSEMDASSALAYLRDKGALVVVPSLADNYPYTVVEAIMEGIPIIASNTGGIPELLKDDRLFRPTARDLSAKLAAVLAGDLPKSAGLYDPASAAEDWLRLHNEQRHIGRLEAARAEIGRTSPLVSVCVPYFNYGQYLEPMIRALKASTYSNFEVIIVNDGSTDPASVEKFDKMKSTSSDNRFVFLSKENGGIGAARNYAAGQARGDFLIFCDADNCSTPEMIEQFLTSIHMTGGDVVSCNYKAFEETVFWPDDATKTEYVYLPIGPALEVGMLVNVFGDANSIIRKSAFDAIGGFQTERHTSWEDWDLLARLCLAGFRLDVCPMELFWYRHTDAGFSRNTSFYQNHMRILKAYADYGPSYMGPLVRNLLAPLHYAMDREHQLARGLEPKLHAKKFFKMAAATAGKLLRRLH